MKRLNFSLIIIFLITIMSVFGQEGVTGQFAEKISSGKLSSFDIYGDYFLFSTEKSISLDLEGARLMDVLKMLSQQTGLNFISTEAVRERSLTAYLQEVPLKQAMDILLKANNLTYEFYPEAKMFVVKEMGRPSIELKTKVYYLKHARIKTSMMDKEIEEELSAGSGEVGEGGSSSESSEGSGESERPDIVESVEKVLSDLGRASTDPQTNALIVIDVPSQFPVIDQLVKKLDIPPLRVLIEVEMLDVKKSDVDKMGVNWPETIASLDVTGSRVTKFPFGEMGNQQNWTFEEHTSPSGNWKLSNLSGNHFAPTVLTVIGAELALNFLKTQTSTKFLARPKILTLSNQTATINITTDEAIGVTKTEAEETGNITYEIERANTGTNLRVTPSVDGDTGEVTLFVKMWQREATNSSFTVSTSDFLSGTIKDPEERSVATVMKMGENQTLLIGGLIKDKVTEAKSKVPILGDIPFLGALFRHQNKTSEERELMVFLTPRIMKQNFASRKKGSVDLLQREQSNLMRQQSIEVVLDKYTVRHRD